MSAKMKFKLMEVILITYLSRYMFGFPFNGDTMILPEVQKWQDDEIELSRRMIKARES